MIISCLHLSVGASGFKFRKVFSKMNSKTLLYIGKRILLAIVTVWVVITITFFVMHMAPGNPFAGEKALSPEVEAALNAKYGLDKPLIVQYFVYLGNVIRFDLGTSIETQRDVLGTVMEGLRTSAAVGLVAAVIALAIGVVLGAVAALKRNSYIDRTIMVVTTALVSMPSFVVGTLLLCTIVLNVSWIKANGADITGYIVPTLTLSLSPMAHITRLTRSSMLDVLGQDYIRTAKAKGVSGVRIIFGHALKNALIPVITYLGPMIAYIVTGSLVIEKIFALPGVSRYFVDSITARDYPLIMGTTIVLATLIVVMNLVSDVMYKVVDPRINLE